MGGEYRRCPSAAHHLGNTSLTGSLQVHRPDAITFVSQEAYRAALFAICFLQVMAAGAVPRVGEELARVAVRRAGRARLPPPAWAPS